MPLWPKQLSPETNMSDNIKIKEAITEHWGERCADHEPGCPICDAWAEFDALLAERDALQAKVEAAHAAGFEACREMAAGILEERGGDGWAEKMEAEWASVQAESIRALAGGKGHE
jgi:hypothetical protein